jgi:thiamine transport system ATP-binding protein
MLEVRQLMVARDGRKLRYDFTLENGQILGIQGLSGVGKSTLLQLIAGYIAPLSGDILWQGQSLLKLAVEQRPVSVLFQENNLFEHVRARENLGLGFGRVIPWDSLLLAASALGVTDQLHKMPGELSGGQRQRIALIRTLLRPEPLVLLDEPFAELDPTTRAVAATWTKAVAQQLNKTVLLVTHQSEDVAQIADHRLTL